MAEQLIIRVDDENNSESWWDALRERHPEVAAALRNNDRARVTLEVAKAIVALPGFWDDESPEYAKNPVIFEGHLIGWSRVDERGEHLSEHRTLTQALSVLHYGPVRVRMTAVNPVAVLDD